MIKYFNAQDLQIRVEEIVTLLRFDHIDLDKVRCVRSRGSSSKNTIARIHGLNRIWQHTLEREPIYIIEVISEKFDKLSRGDKDRTLIHELLHIPRCFGGGFRHHKTHVTEKNVNLWYGRLQQMRRAYKD
ncbi:MAG: putative metallopeptidase [Candidatus Bathyarchaeia archaeon]